MKRHALRAAAALIILAPSAGAAASNRLDVASAARHLRVDAAEANSLSTVWNGRKTIFVDHAAGPTGEEARHLRLVQQAANGRLRAARVTVAEPDGGAFEVAAIGFANADRDPAKELIVLLKRPVRHYDVSGVYYDVRLFDDLKPGRDELALLAGLSEYFGGDCDCEWRDGTRKRFRFDTIAQVRRELRRLGY